jgi:hypothetical protein
MSMNATCCAVGMGGGTKPPDTHSEGTAPYVMSPVAASKWKTSHSCGAEQVKSPSPEPEALP